MRLATFLHVLTGIGLAAFPTARLVAQDHEHPHGHHHAAGPADLWTIADVLALRQNAAVLDAAALDADSSNRPAPSTHGGTRDDGTSGDGTGGDGASGDAPFRFRVFVDAKKLPGKVFEKSPFHAKHTILATAHGGFAYDERKGKGEVYWFLQGAGILRIGTDRAKIDLVATDPVMLGLNMHNATFFEHKGQPMIAWPANEGARVFLTDPDGKLLHTIGRPTVAPYSKGAQYAYAPTDTAYLDGKLWVTDGYASKYVMSYDLDEKKWTGTVFGGKTNKIEPGKFGTNHGITIHRGLLYVAGRFFARIHTYKPDTSFVTMFPLPEGSHPCDFEFFAAGGGLYGVAASLDRPKDSQDKGASIYIVDMQTLKIVSTIKPRDELGLDKFVHVHNVFPTVDDGVVTLFCQAWNGGDFAVLRQVRDEDAGGAKGTRDPGGKERERPRK